MIRINEKLLIAILSSQILVESLLSFFEKTDYYAASYFVPSYLFHCGVLPSIFLLINSKTKISKTLSLSLVIFESFRALLEFIGPVSGSDEIITAVNDYDFYGFTFIVTSLLLSLTINGLLNRNSKLYIHILLLLHKIKCIKR